MSLTKDFCSLPNIIGFVSRNIGTDRELFKILMMHTALTRKSGGFRKIQLACIEGAGAIASFMFIFCQMFDACRSTALAGAMKQHAQYPDF